MSRHLIKFRGAAALYLISMSLWGVTCQMLLAQVTISPVSSKQGLRLITASDPSFAQELDKLLSPSIIQEIHPLLPSSIILINDSGKFVWGFTVIYSYPDYVMPNGAAWQHRIHVSPGGAVDRRHMLAPKSVYLVTPASTITASRQADGHITLNPRSNLDIGSVVTELRALSTKLGSHVLISLDSVLFEDGRLVGPDVSGQALSLNETMRAENDLISSVDGLTGVALRSKLSKLADGPTHDQYSRHLAGLAVAFKGAFDGEGEESVHKDFKNIKATPRFSHGVAVKGNKE